MTPLQPSQAEIEFEREPESGSEDESPDRAAPQGTPPVVLRGTRSGLEIVIDAGTSIDEIVSDLTSRLEQSPGFFAGNDACVRVHGCLPIGALARLEQVTSRFDLRILEVGPERRRGGTPARVSGDGDAASGHVVGAVGVGPGPDAPAPSSSPDPGLAAEPAAAPRLVIGPIRSGVVLDAEGDLIVVGDVNPGAEIQARGNIIVLGRLRGVAHAAVGRECGFILALRFEPQQLRIGRLVARAGESDAPGEGAEIAYATGRTIVVERYQGRVPSGLGAAA